ncbi:PQQ-dependent sugar dehydrogenase [Endozoicomonas ascidiicola]|uniref:PQQ-dependent sugar dehydrogenase n=1 Tax=Endozoicomonas ascidiicola TaxID=1698521 RepID=UPI00082E5826|nr:PQQ-dependent sugar dehydrogenase [Endozoicomonas ascidiicola]
MKAIIIILLSCLTTAAYSAEYHARQIAEGFRIPWAIEFLDSERVVINEKNGTVTLLNIHTGLRQTLFVVNLVDDHGQGGLLDVALAPDSDPERPLLYFTYSKQTAKGTTVALARAHVENNQLSQWQELFVADAVSSTGRHFGSRIAFADGYVFFSIGDRGERENGQDKNTHAGSILRLNLDGSVPDDNPFQKAEGLAEIWSYGHRNPQGLFYDEPTGQLWSIEHGPRGGDEINLIKKGANYGWATVSHGKEYWGPINVGDAISLPEMEDPKLVYIPSIAPGNLMLYRGDQYPELNNHFLAGALKLTHINVVSTDESRLSESQRLMADLGERIRDIAVSPDGYLYFSTDSGKVFLLESF